MAGVVAAILAALGPASTANAHEGNPNYSSTVTAVSPAAAGLRAEVLNYDDSLEVRNQTGSTVVVLGYRDEPYLRIGPDGTVEVNERSPATYLNDDRFAAATVPALANPRAAPRWREVDRTGGHVWHDHRIHYMARNLPPQVDDESVRTKVFDWTVPIEVDGRPAAIEGTLFWVPDSGGFPLAAALSLAVIVLGALALVTRRRRSGSRPPAKPEAW